MKTFMFFGGMLLATGLACADTGLERLEQFMRSARAGRAEFTQTVTAPARADEKTPRSKVSRGHFAFQRPGQFKFVYTAPFEQTIVADGTTLWLHDADLEQVTVREQSAALGSTPAALLAAAADMAALHRDFDLQAVQDAPQEDGAGNMGDVQWVQATPKNRDSEGSTIARVRAALDAGGQLVALEIWDSFGQRSLIRFAAMQIEEKLPAGTFVFTPPAGVDVLRP